MTKFSNIYDRISSELTNKMLGTSLWGVLDITSSKVRYKIIEVVERLNEKKEFRRKGFSLKLIDGMNFIQKIPYFEDNEDFIKEHNLYFNGKPSYIDYLIYMKNEAKKHKQHKTKV